MMSANVTGVMSRSITLINLVAYFMLFITGKVTGKLITCACSTDDCQEQKTDRCNTTSMCYSQYLDRHDGTNPILRGCISSRTPLLCENRRPAVANANWPILVCCSANMCNQDAVPTTPWHPTEKVQEVNKTESEPLTTKNNTKSNEKNSNNQIHSNPTETNSVAFFNPMYIAIIMVSAISLLAIIIVIYLFCRKSRPFHPDCTAVQRNSYLKGHHQVTREDSELPLPLPRSNGIYDNKLAVNT